MEEESSPLARDLVSFFIFGSVGSSLQHGLFCSCGEYGPLSICSAWASHCGGFSCCRPQALGHVGFSSCGTWVQ